MYISTEQTYIFRGHGGKSKLITNLTEINHPDIVILAQEAMQDKNKQLLHRFEEE